MKERIIHVGPDTELTIIGDDELDHGEVRIGDGKSEREKFMEFCAKNGIDHDFHDTGRVLR